MSNEQATLQSMGRKRRILIVDDERINRELLGTALENEYEVLYAEDGAEALRLIRANREILSLVILDLIMPNLAGREVLKQLRADPDTQNIPVIVASVDRSLEIECLRAGASDFIQKPYPDSGVLQARVQRNIELFEDRKIIRSTERDPLTGLYNREYFYSYAARYDLYHQGEAMDAIVIDINHFSLINERYGKPYADEVLRRVGERTREMAHQAGGIACRWEADVFRVYCPHQEDSSAFLEGVSAGFSGEKKASNRVRLRMGVYPNVDKSLDFDRRFDRAKMAADSVRNSFTRSIGFFDDTLHKSELHAEQLIDDFPNAIAQGQFKVYFQPKFDIRTDVPTLESAEALVRWEHPQLGIISPDEFISLFEENGLIRTLDDYIWREAVRQIRDWKDRLNFSVPVSVNVSRMDMFDPNLIYTLQGILERQQLKAEDLHLEVTESVCAEDSQQILDTVKRLRDLGFKIVMDDFGSGYSSLNMLSALPIDALKLDITFIRTAFDERKDPHMISMMVELGQHLGVPVIAEGVETSEQLSGLREVGCTIIQGFYLSEPVPAEEFERFLDERRQIHQIERAAAEEARRREEALAASDASEDERAARRPGIPMRKANLLFALLAFIVASALFAVDSMVTRSYQRMDTAGESYILAQKLATELELASDHLTEQVRCFVVTGEIHYVNDYFREIETTRRWDDAIANLRAILEEGEAAPYEHLNRALELSETLMERQRRAMRCALEAGDYDAAQLPEAMAAIGLSPEEQALSPEELRQRAMQLVFDNDYVETEAQMAANLDLCTQDLIEESDRERVQAASRMSVLLTAQSVLTAALLAVMLGMVIYISAWVRKPLTRMVRRMKAKETVVLNGAEELRFVAETYNAIFEENRKTHERLTYGALHDALTGLYNRSAYDIMRKDIDMSHAALLLVDVDEFKTVNDTYGHDIGDRVLRRVAEVLKFSFRSTDFVFRLGGDEFVVIMTRVNSDKRDLVIDKITQANALLQNPQDDLPPTSLSVGVAFADRENPTGDVFKDADIALYRVKEGGRCGCLVY